MMCSAIRELPAYTHAFARSKPGRPPAVPSIKELQILVEDAWRQGTLALL